MLLINGGMENKKQMTQLHARKILKHFPSKLYHLIVSAAIMRSCPDVQEQWHSCINSDCSVWFFLLDTNGCHPESACLICLTASVSQVTNSTISLGHLGVSSHHMWIYIYVCVHVCLCVQVHVVWKCVYMCCRLHVHQFDYAWQQAWAPGPWNMWGRKFCRQIHSLQVASRTVQPKLTNVCDTVAHCVHSVHAQSTEHLSLWPIKDPSHSPHSLWWTSCRSLQPHLAYHLLEVKKKCVILHSTRMSFG